MWREWRVETVLVIGSERSGTGYAAALLSASGNPCTHEGQYNLTQHGPLTQSESSWLAVPYLPKARREADRVVHIVRDPIESIRSSLERRTFGFPNPYAEFAYEFEPFIKDGPEEVRAMRYWWIWQERISRHDFELVRLEDIADGNRVNAHPMNSPLRGMTWDALPDGPDKKACQERARAYGYEVNA